MTKVMSERKVDYVLDGKLVCKLTVPESAKVLTYHKKKSHKAVMEIGRKLTVDTPNKDKGGLAMAVKMMKEAKAKEEMTDKEIKEAVNSDDKEKQIKALKQLDKEAKSGKTAKRVAAGKGKDYGKSPTGKRAKLTKKQKAEIDHEAASIAREEKEFLEEKAKKEATRKTSTPKRKTATGTKATKKKRTTSSKAGSTAKASGTAKKPAAKKKTAEKKDDAPPQWFYDLAEKHGAETVEKKGKVVIKVDGTNRNWLSYVKKSGEWCFVLDLSGKKQVPANDPKAKTKVTTYMTKTKAE